MVAELVLSVDCEGESVPCLLASVVYWQSYTSIILISAFIFFFFFFLFFTTPGLVACRIFSLHCGVQDLPFNTFIYLWFAGSSLLHGILIVVAFPVAKHRLWGVWASVVVAYGLWSTGFNSCGVRA